MQHTTKHNKPIQTIKGNEQDNNTILSQILADEIQQARAKLNPSAEDIINQIGYTGVIYKWQQYNKL